jgi:hypothetical protein
VFTARSAFGSTAACRFAPAAGCFFALARCGFANQSGMLADLAEAPLQDLYILPIQRFNCRFHADPPSNNARFRSLPATVSISSADCGSSFPVRFVIGGLLFHKPLGTTFTIAPDESRGQRFSVRKRPFFNSFYLQCFQSVTAKRLCIGRGPAVYKTAPFRSVL